jgi:hypothetical protein
LSRSKSAWFTPDHAGEIVKIRYNFACVLFPIGEQSFRSFTGTADTYALAASYAVMAITFRRVMLLART